jgi:hypothetical protein
MNAQHTKQLRHLALQQLLRLRDPSVLASQAVQYTCPTAERCSCQPQLLLYSSAAL